MFAILDGEWLTPQQVVDLMAIHGIMMHKKTFIRKFLEPGNELLPIAPNPPSRPERRKLLVSRVAVMELLKD